MNTLVIGSGGREHAICGAFYRSKRVLKIYCASGNAGIAEIAECVNIEPENIEELLKFAKNNAVDLTFVGGETALSLGIVDKFGAQGLRIIGPNMSASKLEASKSFAKDFMFRHNIPTAKYRSVNSTLEALEILQSGEFSGEVSPVVVKADGLASGKGVVVAENRAEAVGAINQLHNLAGKSATKKIILEECLFGREVSLLMFADGENFALMPPARDHKRIGEGDTGPNTGGMGTITDSTLLSAAQTEQIINEIIKPTLKGCADEGFPFRGILFLGLMMVDAVSGQRSGVSSKENSEPPSAAANSQLQPMLLEYNVRFGDPETQSILVRLKTDIVEICDAILAGTLDKLPISWHEGSSATIVLASKGYPEKPQTGAVIHGLEKLQNDISIFHAGTSKNENEEFVTSAGRVLGVTSTADNLQEALDKAYKAVKNISWDGMQYRRDIGK
ncbi:MAG: phosphoribosylamine--glycine ligase [Acidobacteriota bacterium]|nr:phosphoribosylamine--glycine ligase [Acidobacteriota bacterium]